VRPQEHRMKGGKTGSFAERLRGGYAVNEREANERRSQVPMAFSPKTIPVPRLECVQLSLTS
jgi:hypothetical protein